MAAFAPPLGTEVLLMVRTAASLVEIDGGRGHLRSASHPHEHRRFCNSGAHMASRGIPNRWLGIPGDQESASSTCQPGFRRFSRESNAPDSSLAEAACPRGRRADGRPLIANPKIFAPHEDFRV